MHLAISGLLKRVSEATHVDDEGKYLEHCDKVKA